MKPLIRLASCFTKVGAGTAEFLGNSAYDGFGALIVDGDALIADGKMIVDKGLR